MDCSERNSVSLKMEAARSSETSEEINYPTRCHYPQNRFNITTFSLTDGVMVQRLLSSNTSKVCESTEQMRLPYQIKTQTEYT
jgi:hypothetical protein